MEEFMANRALLVGINAYPGSPLRGCINDIDDMSQFLIQKRGFQTEEIRRLTDASATTAAITDTLSNWLVKDASKDDRLFFHFSGHGSTLPGSDGDIHDVICPVDFDFTEELALSDVDFTKIFAPLTADVEFNWISDSCHSGDLTREITRGLTNAIPRYLAPPPAISAQINAMQAKRGVRRPLSRAVAHLNGAFISGCKSDETSADAYFDPKYNGAFTYYLLKELGKPGGIKEKLKMVAGNVEHSLTENGYKQHPQLRGAPEICERPFMAN
jgi:metacaspase-1